MEIISSGPEMTREIGRAIGDLLISGDIICLYGDLGSGKTCLAQGMIKGLGVMEEKYLRSPSFTLINQYKGRLAVCHIDLYRIDNPEEIEDIGIEEHLYGDEVVIIEWAEKLKGSLPEGKIDIHIFFIDMYTRKLIISCPDSRVKEFSRLRVGELIP
ncbi:MAG: tRNA (adenosine(37)-N6)-threonylcarbamoyltransferase complex ATPase subunit type 1 TsaE [Nitrospinota bacterium]